MDTELASRLTKLARQIKILEKAETLSLTFDAQEKILFSQLFLKTTGVIAHREALTYSSPEWKQFCDAQVIAKTEYNKAKRFYDLLDKAYLAEHLSFKVHASAIQRGVE